MSVKRFIFFAILIVVVMAAAFYLYKSFTRISPDISEQVTVNIPENNALEKEVQVEVPVKSSNGIEEVAIGLNVPWEIAFLPDGGMLVTERPGMLTVLGKSKFSIPIEDAYEESESGLMGLVLHPDFSENHWIYLYYTSRQNSNYLNQVVRYKFEGNKISEKKVIIEYIPGFSHHDGGRIAFGPDGYLYITTGDTTNDDIAQDINSLGGKILRLKDDGSVPDGNPFGNAVYSYGHRNPQGLAWDNEGRLWSTEHGPSGDPHGYDEVNLIEIGNNYGWPYILGMQTRAGMVAPIINSGISDTWAPAGMAYWNGRLFFGGLRGEALYEAVIQDDGSLILKRHFENKFGRIRAVVLGPDNYLYISTSNRDGRGNEHQGDDRILKINPEQFL